MISACAELVPQKPLTPKEVNDACRQSLPPHPTKEEWLLCAALKNDLKSQLRLANTYFTDKPTKENCAKGLWWYHQAEKHNDSTTYAQLSEIYSGYPLYDVAKKRVMCANKGLLPKDKVKAHAYLIAAQTRLIEVQKKKYPKRYLAMCRPDYSLAIIESASELNELQLKQAEQRASQLLSNHKE